MRWATRSTRSRASITACSSSRPTGRASNTGMFWEKLGRGEYRRRSVQAGRQGRQRDLDPGELQPDLRHERQAVQGRQVRHRRHRAGEGKRDAAIDRPADPGRRSGGRRQRSVPAHPAGRQVRRTCGALRRRQWFARHYGVGGDRDQDGFPRRSPMRPARSPPRRRICRSEPKSRPRASSRPRPRWKRSPRR